MRFCENLAVTIRLRRTRLLRRPTKNDSRSPVLRRWRIHHLSPVHSAVLPFVFFSRRQGFRSRSGLPLLAGIAATFSLVAAVATLAGGWMIRAKSISAAVRQFWCSCCSGSHYSFPRLAEYTSRPFVRLGGKVQVQETSTPSAGRSFLLGISTGLLWAPCAGPILGLILTGAAVHGRRVPHKGAFSRTGSDVSFLIISMTQCYDDVTWSTL